MQPPLSPPPLTQSPTVARPTGLTQTGAPKRRRRGVFVPNPIKPRWRARVPLLASEGGAAAAESVAPMRTSLAALLTGHILRDGELVLLILKPSLWFILFNSMLFSALVLMGMIGAKLVLPPMSARAVIEVGVLLIASRVMWAVLQWMGRLYVLTDLRVVRLAGVFNVEIFDCPLRKIADTRLTRNFRERLWRLGSIEIQPSSDACLPTVWQTISRPVEVYETVRATIERAKQGDNGLRL